MSKKVHLLKSQSQCACGQSSYSNFATGLREFLLLPEDQQCKNCYNTNYREEMESELEQKREATPEELKQSKYQPWIEKYGISQEVVDHFDRSPYDVEVSKIPFLTCKDCLVREYYSTRENESCEVSCFNGDGFVFIKKQSPKEETKTEDCKITHYTKDQKIIEQVRNYCEFNTSVFNSEFHNDYFIVDFYRATELTSFIKYLSEITNNVEKYGTTYAPKDVAFNPKEETLLKEPLKESEVPFSKQQSEHYQNGVETIKKIEMILTILGDKITAKEGYLIGNVIKYADRMGLKDDINKDAYKCADYLYRAISTKWISEK